ncbi:MAG TPA: hypothetical protein VGV86_07635, partial [Acidimicrobiales bacterium]|nr:hypothetical protein [Acidimicrobiales bacterium]
MAAIPAVVLAQGGATGFVEICKEADGPFVTGDFDFEVDGRTLTVPVGACSGPLELPAGRATIAEVAVEGVSVTDVRTSPTDRLISRTVDTRTAVVTVVAGDVSTQTVVTFLNRADLAPLKVCKVAGTGIARGTEFTFLAGARTVAVPAGPAPGGYCVVAGSFPVATNVSVSELVPRGVQVSDISIAPADRRVGAANLAGGSVIVRIGSGFSEATFTNAAVTTTTTQPPATTAPTTVPPTTTSTTVLPTT